MASSGSIWVSLGLTTANFQKGLKGARTQLKGFSGAMKGLGAGLSGIFNPTTLGLGAVIGLGAAISDAFGKINAFQKAGSDLKAILQGTATEMESLTTQAKDLGSTTAFTATEVSMLQKELAKLGFAQQQIENMTPAILALAAASGTELAEAAMIAGSTLNAFGLESKDMTHTADVMALSFSSSALDMENFAETMKNAAPIAKVTGVSLEQASAAAGVLANNGIKGSKAGTDLRRVFSELVKDGKPLAESLEDIAKEMDGASTKADKLQIAEDLVGERAKGALLILAEQRGTLDELAESFVNADGEAQIMAETMLDNVQGSMTKASSAYEGFILSVEDGDGVISKAVKSMVDGFTGVLQSLTDLANADGALGFFERIGALVNPAAKDFLDARDAAVELKEGVEEVAEVMPDLEVAVGGADEEVVELTDAQKKAASAAALLKRNTKELSKELLIAPNAASAYKKTIESLKNAFEDKEPVKLNVPATVAVITESSEDTVGKITGEMIKLGEDAGKALSDGLTAASQQGLEAVGELLASGDTAGFGNALISAFSGLLSSFGQQMIALGLAQDSLKASLALGPFGAGLAIAGGVALIAIASAINANLAQGFAAGGLVTGPVMGLVGEGIGTTKSNPEVISPLDKLKNFIQPQGMGMGGEVKFRIEGNQLVGILKRQGKSDKYSQ